MSRPLQTASRTGVQEYYSMCDSPREFSEQSPGSSWNSWWEIQNHALLVIQPMKRTCNQKNAGMVPINCLLFVWYWSVLIIQTHLDWLLLCQGLTALTKLNKAGAHRPWLWAIHTLPPVESSGNLCNNNSNSNNNHQNYQLLPARSKFPDVCWQEPLLIEPSWNWWLWAWVAAVGWSQLSGTSWPQRYRVFGEFNFSMSPPLLLVHRAMLIPSFESADRMTFAFEPMKSSCLCLVIVRCFSLGLIWSWQPPQQRRNVFVASLAAFRTSSVFLQTIYLRLEEKSTKGCWGICTRRHERTGERFLLYLTCSHAKAVRSQNFGYRQELETTLVYASAIGAIGTGGQLASVRHPSTATAVYRGHMTISVPGVGISQKRYWLCSQTRFPDSEADTLAFVIDVCMI